MAMGVVSEADFLAELEELNGEVKPLARPGRKPGDINVPQHIREEIAELSITEGRPAALDRAKELGISSSSVSAYSKGATSTDSYNQPSRRLLDHINKTRRRHVKKASHKLGLALDEITPEKLEGMRARDLASVAKDMSTIIKNMEPSSDVANSNGGPQFIIYAPSFRKEETYEVIERVDE